MSITSTTSRNDYTGNGSTDTYSYTFKIFANTDLLVTKNIAGVESTLALTTDYTVTGVGSAAGGTIVLTAGVLTSGHLLTIRRVRPIKQSTDIRNQGVFYPESHENAFDSLVMIDQGQQDEIDRSVKLPETVSASSFDPTLPADMVAYDIIRVNAAATGFEAVQETALAFDSASPATTKGDIVVHNGSTNIRVGVGADKSYLKADSAEASGVKWVAPVLTTKGDIATFSTVEARLPVGANGKVLKADSTQATGLIWGNAGGGGGSLQWIEADQSPVASVVNNFQVYEFEDALTQYLYASIRVPSTYTAGDQIKLLLTFYSAGTSGTALIQTQTTLIRTGTDLISSTTNQRTSTNSAVTLSGPTVNIPQAVILDLTSSSGQVNSVSVSPGDILLVRLTRDTTTDTTTSSVYVPVYGAETTFS